MKEYKIASKIDLFRKNYWRLVGLAETNTEIITLKKCLINLVMYKKNFNLHLKEIIHTKDIKKIT